jgi:hypothetical protein
MATSGTTAFNLDILQICEEAYERAGFEMRSGYELRTARRSLQLMMLEWANRGINLWTVNEANISMVAGTATYTLATDCIDVLDGVMRKGSGSSQVDYSLTRMSVTSYAQRTNKNTEGRPTEMYVDRQLSPTVTFWPVPSSTDWSFNYWYLGRIEDVGANTNNVDVPDRFLPALVAGLTFYVAMKKPEATARIPALKAFYDEQFDLAAEEDRSKANSFILPYVDHI